MIPLALARGGSFVTLEPTEQLRTNLDVVRRFVDVPLGPDEFGTGRWRVAAG